MRKNVVICGAGGLAREAYQMLQESIEGNNDIDFKGFLAPENTLADFPYLAEFYLGSEDDFPFSPDVHLILAIGDVLIRQKVYAKLKEKKFAFYNLIHPSSRIAPTAEIGEGNIIGYNCVLFPDTKVGSGNLLNGYNMVHHDSVVGDFNNLYSRVIMTGATHLGDQNIIGTAAIILPHSTIPSGCRIGAGVIFGGNVQ